jgi:hypothetical protein
VTPGQVFAMTTADPFLVVADVDARQYLYVHAPDGQRLGRFRDEPYYQTRPVWDALHRRVYFSASSFYTQEILPDGTLGVRGHGPNQPTVPMGQPIRLNTDATQVFLGPDGIFDLATLMRQHKLDTTVADAVWLGEELLTLESAASGQSRLRHYDASYRIDLEIPFAGDPIALHEHAGVVSVVVYAGGDTVIHSFALPADGDGDGVPNELDAFPLDPAASRDADGDGWPGHWNPGYGEEDSTTGLQRDGFPDDFGCQLPEHGDQYGVCDVSNVLPDAPELPLCYRPPALPDLDNGWLSVPKVDEIIPVCAGWLFVADGELQRIELRNSFDGWRLGAVYPLPAASGDMELDAVHKQLYAALPDEHSVASIDLSSGEVTLIPLPEEAIAVAPGADGDLFVSTRPYTYSRAGHLFRIRAGATEAEGGWPIPALLIRYNPARDEIVVGDAGYSPSYLWRYGFDASGTLTQLQELREGGSNGTSLDLSPDSQHLVFVSGGGNGEGYSIYDFDPGDLTQVRGEWVTDAYPTSAGFAPDSTMLAASNVDSLILFDVSSHEELARYTPGTCWLDSFNDVSFEPGGELVFSRQNCGQNPWTYTLIHWMWRPR